MNQKADTADTIEETIKKLHMKNAAGNLDLFGRAFIDNRELTLWEHDTLSLPRPARKWRKKARAFAREHIRPFALQADLDPEKFDPENLFKLAARQGFLSLMLVPPIGRANYRLFFRNPAFLPAIVAEEFCTECGGLGLLLMAHNLGIAPLMLSGHISSYIRQFLPFYLKSTWLGNPRCMAFAITEPGAGSDVEETEGGATAKLVTTAKAVKGGYILNGTKCFISDGAVADKVTVYAKLEGQGLESWTCFLVEKSMKGFSVGRHEKKMGQRASDASELIFDNVFIPKKNIIGKLRSGWPNNRNVINYSRPVVGAMAIGHGRGAFERALDFCRNTSLGPKKLIEYQEVQIELADMMTTLSAARSLVWHSTSKFRCNQAASSIAKVFASDAAFKVCNQAMELVGDHSYIHSNGIERSMRDSRLTQIYEGTNQINRLSIIEHQWTAEINKMHKT
ncbi:MAG: acyl-CoA/acyl-ACP dehydrogenase [bacterium]|nr:acyl-CoA/acyl-ACP dehydrogenase [bacterium]